MKGSTSLLLILLSMNSDSILYTEAAMPTACEELAWSGTSTVQEGDRD